MKVILLQDVKGKGKKGQMLEVECDGRKFGCHLLGLGKEFYLGIIGCEGRNRFYDFKVISK